LFGGGLSLIFPQLAILYIGLLLIYFFVSLIVSILIASIHKAWRSFPIIPLAFLIIHFCYGLGFWAGVVRWGLIPSKNVD
jgi:hypothetical protein